MIRAVVRRIILSVRLTFIESPQFTADWSAAGYGDEELRALQNLLMDRPNAGDAMQNTGGLRKLRFAGKGKGKSGASRVCYVHVPKRQEIVLLIVFVKGEKANLSRAECNQVKPLINRIKAAPSW